MRQADGTAAATRTIVRRWLVSTDRRCPSAGRHYTNCDKTFHLLCALREGCQVSRLTPTSLRFNAFCAQVSPIPAPLPPGAPSLDLSEAVLPAPTPRMAYSGTIFCLLSCCLCSVLCCTVQCVDSCPAAAAAAAEEGCVSALSLDEWSQTFPDDPYDICATCRKTATKCKCRGKEN